MHSFQCYNFDLYIFNVVPFITVYLINCSVKCIRKSFVFSGYSENENERKNELIFLFFFSHKTTKKLIFFEIID